MRFWTKSGSLDIAVTAMCITSAPAAAPLTEIDVSATGRPVNKQETMLSVQVVEEQQLQDLGIDDLNQAALSLPGLALGFGPISQVINLHGTGAIQESCVEQSVGLTAPRTVQLEASYRWGH